MAPERMLAFCVGAGQLPSHMALLQKLEREEVGQLARSMAFGYIISPAASVRHLCHLCGVCEIFVHLII